MGCAFIKLDFDLIPAVFLGRPNRFTALVRVDGEEAHAHLPNSGRLTTALCLGDKAYLRRHEARSRRKSIYSVFAVQHGFTPIIVDAQFSNFLAKKSVEFGLIRELFGYRIVRENSKPNADSKVRLDLIAEDNSDMFYIEVKCVTHAVGQIALFPDAPTSRGRRHIVELLRLVKRGFKAGLIFSVQRPDTEIIRPNSEVDPRFAELLERAISNGLKVFTLKSTFIPPETVILESNKPAFQL
ncbi:DNA/RNA nuclease SfsA [Candidatus Bathyarchaeota archaeon]|nr:DNA/RNA nuclease SfsA [Candidatus Bathyarchaeota archaeon]